MYNSNLIPTVADCDAVLTEVSKIKSNLLYRQLTLSRQVTSQMGDAASLPAKLTHLQAKLASATETLAMYLNGTKRDRQEKKQNSYEIEERALANKVEARGPVATLKKQYSLEFLEEQILEVDLYYAAVEMRKAALIAEAA